MAWIPYEHLCEYDRHHRPAILTVVVGCYGWATFALGAFSSAPPSAILAAGFFLGLPAFCMVCFFMTRCRKHTVGVVLLILLSGWLGAFLGSASTYEEPKRKLQLNRSRDGSFHLRRP